MERIPQNAEQVVASCRDNMAEIAQSLNRCFDADYRLEVGQVATFHPDQLGNERLGAGLAVAFQIGELGLLALVPESLGIPDWYAAPDASQSARLETLAVEWSVTVLPLEFEASQTAATSVGSLGAELTHSRPIPGATLLELLVRHSSTDAAADDSTLAETSPDGRIYMVWPVANPPLPTIDETVADQTVRTPPASTAAQPPTRVALRRIMTLPVTVVVRLAEKRMEVQNVRVLTPGMLIPFQKSCEDQLDLYVNNVLYGRGEAVKIGEKFGLKVNEVGVKTEREVPILNC